MNLSERVTFHAFSLAMALSSCAIAQTTPGQQPPPKSWVDPDTGHRILRLTDEVNSRGLYFEENAFTADGTDMIYVGPKGLYDLNLTTFTSQLLVEGRMSSIVVGPKTRRVFYLDHTDFRIHSVNIDTKEIQKFPSLPLRGELTTINADETLLGGTMPEGNEKQYVQYELDIFQEQEPVRHQSLVSLQAYQAAIHQAKDHPGDADLQAAKAAAQAKWQADSAATQALPDARDLAWKRRFQAHTPEDIFTVNLETGQSKIVLKTVDWLVDVQFSPTDPNLILYAHEGPPLEVDRVWTVRTDGSRNHLLYHRVDPTGITSNEFWGHDGKTVWFELQEKQGEGYAIGGIDTETGNLTVHRVDKADASQHYNVAADGSLFCGDGNPWADPMLPSPTARPHQPSRWVELFEPLPDGSLHATRLAHMPVTGNRVSPDKKWVIFTSNQFTNTYIFAAEVTKSSSETPPRIPADDGHASAAP